MWVPQKKGFVPLAIGCWVFCSECLADFRVYVTINKQWFRIKCDENGFSGFGRWCWWCNSIRTIGAVLMRALAALRRRHLKVNTNNNSSKKDSPTNNFIAVIRLKAFIQAYFSEVQAAPTLKSRLSIIYLWIDYRERESHARESIRPINFVGPNRIYFSTPISIYTCVLYIQFYGSTTSCLLFFPVHRRCDVS